jgi:hypothetical protein
MGCSIQAAASAVRDGHGVCWLDAGCAPLVAHRVHALLAPSVPPTTPPSPSLSTLIHHLAIPALAHLLALILRPPPNFPRPGTSLVVVDALPALIDTAYPRNQHPRPRSDHARWAATRRYAVITDLMAALAKFAALHNVALVVMTQTATRIRPQDRALLVPALSGPEWDSGVSTRLLLFRDWHSRFAALTKAHGKAPAGGGDMGTLVPFTIESNGLRALSTPDHVGKTLLLPIQSTSAKRSFSELDDNTAPEPGSDELYGWIEDDAVAAEGLVVDPKSLADPDSESHLDVQGRTKLTRPSSP